jgi:hypothetical protein
LSEYDEFGAFKTPPTPTTKKEKKKEKDFVRIALDFNFCSWNGENSTAPKKKKNKCSSALIYYQHSAPA